MGYILALDQGTTSSRAIIFDREGLPRSMAQQEIRQIYPQAGWVEQDAEEIWTSQLAVAREAMEKCSVSAADIAAIGIANQRETTVAWDRRNGRPIHNAVVWQDRRTAPACAALQKRGLDSLFRQRTGLLIDPYFSASKMAWILENVAGARELAEAGDLVFGTVDSWLIWNLTGGRVHRSDVSNASRTMLFNIHDLCWDRELLEVMGIPPSTLPEVCGSSEILAETAEGVFPRPIPIAGVAGDQQAALFGQVCTSRGMVKNTYGTGCFMLMNTGQTPVLSRNRLLSTVAWRIGGRTEYALEGSVFVAGAAVQWLRDGLGIIGSSADVERLAATVDDNGGVYLVPAFAGLGAPHWDPLARGTITGLTRGSSAAHIARATLESMAFQVADLIGAMNGDSGIDIGEMRVDGGATANNLLMQFQADILGAPVVRPQLLETTALGAAYLAGLAVGFWRDLEEIGSQWRAERVFTPQMKGVRVAELRRQWSNALERAKGWASPAGGVEG